MILIQILIKSVIEGLQTLYSQSFTEKDLQVSQTKVEFEGDYTVVLFSLIKTLKKSPDELGNDLGDFLTTTYSSIFTKYNIIKGFLNLSISDKYLIEFLVKNYNDINFGKQPSAAKKMMVEYSSPNTNKPLHLGHLRNNFLGWSTSEILKANGYEVVKTCIVNDRGIHICKSMIAWQMFANGATPESTNTKGDHFVGKYYVKFNDEYKKEVQELAQSGVATDIAERDAPIMKDTQQMLQDWENGKPNVKSLWKKMNNWVYQGFDITYKRIGSDFDRIYYESETYLLGKDIVEDGLKKNVFFKKDDESVWVDLNEFKLDEKLVLRKDGTSVYITQDIGLVKQKFAEFNPEKSIYVIGDEQIHHMKVLQAICKKMEMPFANDIYHLSYGMVELPSGKMKSREGTVVDADDLVDEMIATAKHHTEELGKVKDFTEDELKELFEIIGLGAMKFYLLRVDPKKRIVFNPEESIDFHGFTGSFIQYTYARIQSILRKIDNWQLTIDNDKGVINETTGSPQVISEDAGLMRLEKDLIITLEQYSTAVIQAGIELNPSVIANYIFNLAKMFNSFYTEHSVANAESERKKILRLRIAVMTANIIKSGMKLLGINVPERM